MATTVALLGVSLPLLSSAGESVAIARSRSTVLRHKVATTSPVTALPTPGTISADFFGTHWLHPQQFPYPKITAASARIWDDGAAWNQLQPRRPDMTDNGWDAAALGRLDQLVLAFNLRHIHPLLDLGQTPAWASTNPGDTQSLYGPGAGYPPVTDAAWTGYVRTVASRYKGKVGAYELWNEANFPTFWDGTAAQLVHMARLAYAAIKSIDPGAVVLSPSLGLRHPAALSWFANYLDAGGASTFDAVALHLYPPRFQVPETMLSLVRSTKALLAAHGAAGTPLWDTEVGYGLGGQGEFYSGDTARGYVARTFLLDSNNGIVHTFYYGWDDQTWAGFYMMTPSGAVSTYGAAEMVVARWITGALPRGCVVGATWPTRYSYTCTYRLPSGLTARAVWAIRGAPKVRTPAGTTKLARLDGSTVAAKAGQILTLGPAPVLVISTS